MTLSITHIGGTTAVGHIHLASQYCFQREIRSQLARINIPTIQIKRNGVVLLKHYLASRRRWHGLHFPALVQPAIIIVGLTYHSQIQRLVRSYQTLIYIKQKVYPMVGHGLHGVRIYGLIQRIPSHSYYLSKTQD